jgi:hypothetical protein
MAPNERRAIRKKQDAATLTPVGAYELWCLTDPQPSYVRRTLVAPGLDCHANWWLDDKLWCEVKP